MQISIAIRRFALPAAFLAATLNPVNPSFAQDWPIEVLADGIGGAWTRSADFDGDGDPDILVQDGATILWFENLRPGWNPILIDVFQDLTFSWVDVFDMDFDGDPDVIQVPFIDPSTLAWNENEMGGTQWERHTISSNVHGGGNMQRSYGDIDGDADMDIVVPYISAGRVVWFENLLGDTVWTEHEIATLSSPIWSTVEDMDEDNDLDIIASNSSSGVQFWYENQLPDTTWSSHVVGNLNGGFVGQCDDIDGDGDPDIVTHSSRSLVYLENPSWNLKTLAVFPEDIIMGVIGDIDGDGDADVTYGGTFYGAGELGWVENPSDSTSWTVHAIDSSLTLALSPNGLSDIEVDGDVDIVAGAYDITTYFGDARWYANPRVIPSVDLPADRGFPRILALFQNYPNPFNPTTTIRYDVPEDAHVTLKILDILGREVASLVDQNMPAGYHKTMFDATRLSSGVYFYQLEAAAFDDPSKYFVEVRKLVTVK